MDIGVDLGEAWGMAERFSSFIYSTITFEYLRSVY